MRTMLDMMNQTGSTAPAFASRGSLPDRTFGTDAI